MSFTLFIDHTEQRKGTNLPANVIAHATTLTNLEHLTGADLILSPLDRPSLKELTKCPASIQALKVHITAGLMIQRKAGGDFIGSIDKLAEIERRMLEWTDRPWLLVTGELKASKSGKAIMNGRTYGISYWGIIGALDYWQLRGGCWTILQHNTLIAKWMSDQAARLQAQDKLSIPRVPKQCIIKESDEIAQIVQTLMSFPRIGQTTAVAIARQTKSLRAALKMLSDPNVLKSKNKVEGIGPKLIEEFRRVMDLKEGEEL